MKTAELFLEVGTEEIPAGFVPPALEALGTLASEGLEKARVDFESVNTCGTTRRLVLHVAGMPVGQPDAVEEVMGPSVSVAFDDDGIMMKIKRTVSPDSSVAHGTASKEVLAVIS